MTKVTVYYDGKCYGDFEPMTERALERIVNIKKCAERKAKTEALKEAEYDHDIATSIAKIEALWTRAEEMLMVANACMENGIKMPKEGKRVFYADSILHRLGFGNVTEAKNGFGIACASCYNSISINGSNYQIDFYNGKVHFEGRKDDNFFRRRLREFVDEFNDFENRFYNWVDMVTQE